MRSSGRLTLMVLTLIFTSPPQMTHAGESPFSVRNTGSVNAGSVAVALLSSFIIGNIVAWSMGAYPQSFPEKAYSAEEQAIEDDLKQEMAAYPDDMAVKTELGQLYFQHNKLDQASAMLGEVVDQSPRNAEALAIYSANEAKQAGAMWDFTWGIAKLNRMDQVIEGLNKAVALDPENATVRLYRMNTLVAFRDRRHHLFKVFEDEAWFQEKIQAEPDHFPEEMKRHFYQVLMKAHLIAAEKGDTDEMQSQHRDRAEFYRSRITPIALNN